MAFRLEVLLYKLSKNYPFYYELLTDVNLKLDNNIKTAGVGIKDQKINLFISPTYFDTLKPAEQVAVLVHEFEHVCLSHLKEEPTEQNNYAMDIAINQNIKGLPDGCLNLDYFIKAGVQAEPFKTWQYYYNLIDKNQDKLEKQKQANDLMGTGNQKQFDNHGNHGNGNQANMEIDDIMIRAYESSKNKGGMSRAVEEHIRGLVKEKAKLNYKAIVNSALKKSLMQEQTHNWNRPSKRYGFSAKGTAQKKIPRLAIWLDTSGSIGQEELNEFFGIVDRFSSIVKTDIFLNFWNTDVYCKSKYKLRQTPNYKVQSGGTCINDTIKHINQDNNDLNLIITDGYFSECNVLPKNTMYIITSNGTTGALNKVRHVQIGG